MKRIQMKYLNFLIYAFILQFLITVYTYADIYKWTDPKTGAVYYSTKQGDKEAKAVDLPPLLREKRKGYKSIQPNKELKSCVNHGGINCQAGPDGDGSVLCYDGFKDASPRFRFSCSSAKLSVTEVSPTNENGSFTVTVRNETSIKAVGAKVLLTSVEGTSISGTGPENIEPLAIAEFEFKTSLPSGKKPAISQFFAKCNNCSFQ